MRPEFVLQNPVPLSPDAFSAFGADEQQAQSNSEVKRATEKLETVVIPQFADYLDKRVSSPRSVDLIESNDWAEDLSQLIYGLNLFSPLEIKFFFDDRKKRYAHERNQCEVLVASFHKSEE